MNRRKRLRKIQYQQYLDEKNYMPWPKDMMKRLAEQLAKGSPLGKGYMDFPLHDIKPTKLAFGDDTYRALRQIAMIKGAPIIVASQRTNPEDLILGGMPDGHLLGTLQKRIKERLDELITSPAQKALFDKPIEPIATGRLW